MVAYVSGSAAPSTVRAGERRQNAQRKFEKASAALAAVVHIRDGPKAELEEVEVSHSALTEWIGAKHMKETWQPVFASGSAWTVVRAVSGHLSEKMFQNENTYADEGGLPEAKTHTSAKRRIETDRILKILNL